MWVQGIRNTDGAILVCHYQDSLCCLLLFVNSFKIVLVISHSFKVYIKIFLLLMKLVVSILDLYIFFKVLINHYNSKIIYLRSSWIGNPSIHWGGGSSKFFKGRDLTDYKFPNLSFILQWNHSLPEFSRAILVFLIGFSQYHKKVLWVVVFTLVKKFLQGPVC